MTVRTQNADPTLEHSPKALRHRALGFSRSMFEAGDGETDDAAVAEARHFEAFLAADGRALATVARRESILKVVQRLRPCFEAKDQVQLAGLLLRYVEEG